MAENIELNEIGDRNEPAEDNDVDEEETDLGGDDRLGELNKSIPVPSGFNPELGEAPNIRRDASVMRRVFTRDRKNFLKEALNINVKKGDGPNSTILFDNLQLTNDQRTGKNKGAKYKGVKILVLKNGNFEYSANTNKKTTDTIQEFKETLEKARAEHARTLDGQIEKNLGVENPDPESIRSEASDTIEDRIENNADTISLYLTEDELREFRGALDIEKQHGQTVEEQLNLLENVEKPHWLKLAQEAEDEGKIECSKLLKVAADTAQLKADHIRLKNNIAPKTGG